jgi:ABC-type dipeptide/oligopeptide/nickel transport system permease subunit
MIRILLPPFLILLICIVFWSENQAMWQAASFGHPLGTDEFGRDMLATLCASILRSAIKGFLLAFLAIAVGILTGYWMVWVESKIVSAVVKILTMIIESIPLFLWVMVMIIVLPSPNLVLILAFSIGTLPFVSRIVSGEIARLKQQPFVEASRLNGASKLRCMAHHIIPNAKPVLAPLVVQLCGAGVAADGLFGLIGLSNRLNLDVGTLLLRGKENALLHPSLILLAMLTIVLLYLYFWCIFIALTHSKHNSFSARLFT